MALSVGDVIRVAITGGTAAADVFQLVHHLKMTAGAGADEDLLMDTEAADYEDAFTEIEDFISDTYSFDTMDFWVRNPTTHEWDGLGTRVLTSLVGLSASDPVPQGVALVGLIVTEVLRRQGRTFLPGVREGDVNDGLATGTLLAAFALYLAKVVSKYTITGGTFKWCTYNTDPTSALYETASLYNGTIILNDVVGYQRRRKPGVGI